jgi:maltose alpha-D-glucosyltransferase/alpha-amylase
VLNTGKDFVFAGFEGDDSRPVSERRIKRSPLRDIATMIGSLFYAAHSPWYAPSPEMTLPQTLTPNLARWANIWFAWTSAAFLDAYLKAAAGAPFIPADEQQRHVLLKVFLLERAVYQLDFGSQTSSEWLRVTLQGILRLLEPT